MSCVHFSASEDAWCNAQAAPNLPWSTPEKRKSKLERLWRLGFSAVPDIRASAAGNADCPVRLLEILAKDESPLVRAWVCRNLRTPRRLLKALRNDADAGIAAYALFRLSVLHSFRA